MSVVPGPVPLSKNKGFFFSLFLLSIVFSILALITGGWIFYSVATVFFIWVCVESAQFVSEEEGSSVILNFFQAGVGLSVITGAVWLIGFALIWFAYHSLP